MPPIFDAAVQIKRTVDIVEVIGDYLPLSRKGRAYVGLCPFHDDHNPSLQVDPERQRFKCWACDKGGDVIAFVQERERVEFLEAVRLLAKRAGIELPALGRSQEGAKVPLYDALIWAEGECHRTLLKAPEAAPARRYLAERGIDAETIGRFRLGYHPDQWEWLQGRAQGTRFSAGVLERAGLIVSRPNSPGYYDRFKGRVLFPVRDIRGRPVAFGGRLLPGQESSSTAKYINSPETPIFHKSGLLYGLDAARDEMHRTRTAVVVEGYTDCVMAHQYGVGNVVGTLGTALTDRHVRLLRQHAETVVLVFDGDAAGQRATDRALELFLAQGADVRLLTLPEGCDPCDVLVQHGTARFGELVSTAVDALTYVLARTSERHDTKSLDGANRSVEAVLQMLARAPGAGENVAAGQRMREHLILDRLAHQFRVPEEVLRRRLAELRRANRRSAARGGAAEKPAPALLDPLERELLEVVLNEPACVEEVHSEVSLDCLSDGPLRVLMGKCFELHQRGEQPTYHRLTAELEDPALKSLVTELDEVAQRKGNGRRRLEGVINRLRRRRADEQLRNLRAELGQVDGNDDREAALLRQIQQQQQQIHKQPV